MRVDLNHELTLRAQDIRRERAEQQEHLRAALARELGAERYSSLMLRIGHAQARFDLDDISVSIEQEAGMPPYWRVYAFDYRAGTSESKSGEALWPLLIDVVSTLYVEREAA